MLNTAIVFPEFVKFTNHPGAAILLSEIYRWASFKNDPCVEADREILTKLTGLYEAQLDDAIKRCEDLRLFSYFDGRVLLNMSEISKAINS